MAESHDAVRSWAESHDPVDDAARGEPDTPADPDERRREAAAAEQENVDNHRDDDPFLS